MRTSSLLSLALVPAALVAQAPAPMTFSQRFKAEGPVVEQLLKDLQPLEALAKAEAMLPETKPTFNKSDVNAGRASSFQFSDLVRTYHLAGKAAISAGNWEKGRDYFVKARDYAQENFDQTTQVLTPAMDAWKGPLETARKAMDEGAARFTELSTKQPLTPEEDNELKNFQIHKQNLVNGEKITKLLTQDITVTKNELNAFAPMIAGSEKAITDEKTEMDKEIASKKFNGSKDKYLVAVLNPKNLEGRATKQEKLNFLFRVQFHTSNPVQVGKIKAVIDRVRKDEDPFPVAKPAAKKKKTK
jgi:hypothetical protein